MIYRDVPSGFVLPKPKDPGDVFDIACSFSGLLQSDTISTATVTATNATIDSSSVTGNVVTFFISGGTDCTLAEIKITIVTANVTARTFVRRVHMKIKNR